MPKRSSKKKQEEADAGDSNVRAFEVIQEATREVEDPPEELPEKNPAAVALGRLGGKKGGPARAAKLSSERKSEIARNAALARWRRRSEEQE